MENIDFDKLLSDYNNAVDAWVDAIRAEEALATSDHSMLAMEHWDTAGLNVHDAELAAKRPATTTRTPSAERTTASNRYRVRSQIALNRVFSGFQ
jgi:hypothetical protein